MNYQLWDSAFWLKFTFLFQFILFFSLFCVLNILVGIQIHFLNIFSLSLMNFNERRFMSICERLSEGILWIFAERWMNNLCYNFYWGLFRKLWAENFLKNLRVLLKKNLFHFRFIWSEFRSLTRLILLNILHCWDRSVKQ